MFLLFPILKCVKTLKNKTLRTIKFELEECIFSLNLLIEFPLLNVAYLVQKL